MVIGITDRNQTRKIGAYGYADIKAKKPTPETLFEIGLVTKYVHSDFADAGPKQFDAPAKYVAYVGRHDVNHNPEESDVSVHVLKGKLIMGGNALVTVGPATFRPASPDFNPGRASFDTILDGKAALLLLVPNSEGECLLRSVRCGLGRCKDNWLPQLLQLPCLQLGMTNNHAP
jgi:hypothetical protein